jgi:hypothetical protein
LTARAGKERKRTRKSVIKKESGQERRRRWRNDVVPNWERKELSDRIEREDECGNL